MTEIEKIFQCEMLLQLISDQVAVLHVLSPPLHAGGAKLRHFTLRFEHIRKIKIWLLNQHLGSKYQFDCGLKPCMTPLIFSWTSV